MRKQIMWLFFWMFVLVGILIVTCTQDYSSDRDTVFNTDKQLESFPAEDMPGAASAPLLRIPEPLGYGSDDKMLFYSTDNEVLPDPLEKIINEAEIINNK